MQMTIYKNEHGTLYAVREKDGAPRLCCMAVDNAKWVVSGVLAACAGADATTAEELQAVLDRAAEVKGWEAVEAAPGQSDETPAAAPLAKPGQNAPAVFSYDGLDENTRQALRISEKMILEARQTFVVQVAEAVNIAHDALCGPGVVPNWDNSLAHGNRGEETFRAWCTYMGFTKSSAYRLLSVHKLIAGASAEEMAHLEAASPSLLYAAAKPSAPPELVQAVKEGNITTHKQYREAMERLRAVEAERNELELQTNTELDTLRKQLEAAKSEAETAGMMAETARETARQCRDQLEQAKEQNNALLDQQAVHIARIQELEARPVDVAVQQPGPDEIERWREEGREEVRKIDLRELSSLRKTIENKIVESNQLRQRLAAAPAAPTADDCQRLMDTLADTLDGFRAMIRQTFDRAQLTPESFERITSRTRNTLGNLSGYLISLCPDRDDKEDDPFAE